MMIGNLSWDLISDSKKPWMEVLKHKYLNGDNIMDHKPKVTSFPIWTAIFFGLSYFKEGYRWRVGNGHGISLWKDKWAGDRHLIELVPNTAETELALKVSNVISGRKEWDLSAIAAILGEDVIQSIKAIRIPRWAI